MLQNRKILHFLKKIGFDTAEKGPYKVCYKGRTPSNSDAVGSLHLQPHGSLAARELVADWLTAGFIDAGPRRDSQGPVA